jgi:hypothetical protein
MFFLYIVEHLIEGIHLLNKWVILFLISVHQRAIVGNASYVLNRVTFSELWPKRT